MPRLIKCLKSHPTGDSPITNNRHCVVIIAGKVTGNSHPKGSRNRGTSMASAKLVVLTLVTADKT